MNFNCQGGCGKSTLVSDLTPESLPIGGAMCFDCARKYEVEHPGTHICICTEDGWALFSDLLADVMNGR